MEHGSPFSAEEDGFAAFRSDKQKQMKYNTLMLPGGKSSDFVSLVYEHLVDGNRQVRIGWWGQVGENYLNVLVARARDREGKLNPESSGYSGENDFCDITED